MRILVLSSWFRESAEASIALALGTAHEVTSFDYAQRRMTLHTPVLHRLNVVLDLGLKALQKPPSYFADRELLRWIKGRRFDLIVIVTINRVPADVVAALRSETGALVVGWFTDHIVNIGAAQFCEAPYHRIFFKDKTVVDRFRDGLASDRFDYLPQAFDPLLHRPVPDRFAPPDAAVDVATFGNSYAWRAHLMSPLLEQADIRSIVYGRPSWGIAPQLARAYRREVLGLEKSAAMRVARIALNTNHFAELGGVNKRTFELGAMGAFQLTDGPRVAEIFEPGVECATFRGPQGLLEKVRYYLGRPAERAEIARRGLARAWRDHTYHTRLNQAFDSIPELRSAAKLVVPSGPPDPEADLPPGR